MSYYTPKITYPRNINEVISSTPNTFIWETSGTNSQVAYRLYIRQNSDNSIVYDSTKLTSTNKYHVVPSATLTANILYKWQLLSYYTGSDYTESRYEVFKAIGVPTLVLSSTPTTEQLYNFTYTYTHPQNIKVKTYVMNLYENTTLVSTSGTIYPATPISSGGTIQHEFDGMVSGTQYKVQCEVLTQNDYEILSSLTSFTVTYDYPEAPQFFTLTEYDDIGAIKLSWERMLRILGVVTGTYSYVTGKYGYGIHLNSGATLYYATAIPEYFTLTLWCKLPVGFTGKILDFTNGFEFGYTGTKYYYQSSYRITAGLPRTLDTDWFFIGIKPNEIIVLTSSYIEYLR